MADNIYMKISFVDSSIIISNYFLNYYIISRCNMSSMGTTQTHTHASTGYYLSLRKCVLFLSNQDWNITYSKWHCHHKCYVEYSTCEYKAKLYCVKQNTFSNTVSSKWLTTKHIENNQNIIYVHNLYKKQDGR